MNESSVKVAVRIRPLTQKEQQNKCNECLTVISNQILMDSSRQFNFDFCFNSEASQCSVFEQSVVPLLNKFYEGYNATVLAYGQTSAGKTYTLGTALAYDQAELNGVVPRSIEAIFGYIASQAENVKFKLTVSFLELYNEELIDLLAPHVKQKQLHIREDGQGGIYWAGVKEEQVETAQDVLACLHKGSLCRKTGSTDMNLTSSRSHAIFSISMQQDYLGGDSKRLVGKFHFVDLAGSERLKKTKSTGDRAKEGISINGGLLAMGKVIHALNDQSSHVPYRDSKLTRLLQDSLGGNSQTLMIACVSPADSNFGETLSTLNYAARARNIKNKVTINQDYQAMEVHQLRAEVARLKIELLALKSTGGTTEVVAGDDQVKRDNELLQSECRQLEMKTYQYQQRIQTLQQQLLTAETERDSLKLSGEDEVELHPLVVQYKEELQEMKQQLEQRPVIHSKVSETIDKAKQSIKNEMKLLAQTKLPDLDEDLNISMGSVSGDEFEHEDKMLGLLDQIETDISVKEELVTQLESAQLEFLNMRDNYEDKIKQLSDALNFTQKERDDAMKKSDVVENKDKVRMRYEDKLRKLQLEMNDYKKKHEDVQKQLAKKKEQNDNLIRNLKSSVEAMKQDKLRMMSRIKKREAALRESEQQKEREISRLKRKEKQMLDKTKQLERDNQLQKQVIKKRTEESLQLQGKFRNLTALGSRIAKSPLAKRLWSPSKRKVKRESAPMSPMVARKSWKAMFKFDDPQPSVVQVQKSQLDNQLNLYINSRQTTDIVDSLLQKREALVVEQQQLEQEREALKDDQEALDELNSRIEVVDAEINYFSSRIRSALKDLALDDDDDNYESAISMVREMDTEGSRQLMELVIQDVVKLKLKEHNRQLEIQALEKNTESLKRTIQALRKTALETTLKSEVAKLSSAPEDRSTTPDKSLNRRRSWTTQSPMPKSNVFERLHREQTIASLAKIHQ